MPMIEITAGDGGTFNAYIARPESNTEKAPVVILIQEIFGINQEMRDKCHDMAKKGYVALCPDLFWRVEPGIKLVDSVPEQLERAFELFGLFDADKGMQDLASTLAHARTLENTNGLVGCIGYCLGGMLAYRMAAETDVDASVSYYGVGIQDMLDKAANIKKPLLMHIAEKDEFVPPDAQEKIIAHFKENTLVQTYSYEDADHAFARGNGMHYKEDAAKLANQRTDAFFTENLLDAA